MTLHVFVTTLVLALSLTACADAPSTSVSQGPRGMWDAAEVDAYTITVERRCFCPGVGPYVVTVVDGEISSVTHAGKDVDPDGEMLRDWPLTVEELFREVTEAEGNADDLAVSYDPDLGYPTKIAIDRWEDAIDDEVTYVVRDLQVDA